MDLPLDDLDDSPVASQNWREETGPLRQYLDPPIENPDLPLDDHEVRLASVNLKLFSAIMNGLRFTDLLPAFDQFTIFHLCPSEIELIFILIDS